MSALQLVLAPEDWSAPRTWLPALSAYVTTARPGEPVSLLVDCSAPGSVELLSHACDRLTRGRAFGDVAAVTDPAELPPGATRIGGARDVRAALGAAGPGDDGGDPAAVMARVRAAKALHDELVALEDARRFHAAGDPFAGGARPRVTVRIPTWHGHETLLERTLPSVLVAPWEGVEVVVCSDGPDPDARRAVEGLRDARVRYLELPERPVYPSHPQNLWRVGGIHAVNHALDAAAEGSFIAPLDHDDAFTLGHVPELLAVLERSGADLAYGQALCELADGAWVINGSAPLAHGEIAHGAVLYSPRLQHVRLDPDAWLLAEPGDWNCWRRMDAAGAHAVHLPRPVLVHFQERTALGDEQQSDRAFSEPTDAEALRDVRATSAAFLLDVRFL